jgi:hypothetical protein
LTARPDAYVQVFDNERARAWKLALEPGQSVGPISHYGKPACYMGEGGSITFMGMLGAKFPKAQFLITGVLGPKSNAHGPNEFLHIGYSKKLTACIASIISDHAAAHVG